MNLQAGQYTIAFDWRSNGNQGVDFLAAFLVPATAQRLVGGFGDLVENKPYTSYSFSTNSLKDGWNLLGGSILQLSNTWQNFAQAVTITEPVIYYLVYYLKNYYQGWVTPSFTASSYIDIVVVFLLPCVSLS